MEPHPCSPACSDTQSQRACKSEGARTWRYWPPVLQRAKNRALPRQGSHTAGVVVAARGRLVPCLRDEGPCASATLYASDAHCQLGSSRQDGEWYCGHGCVCAEYGPIEFRLVLRTMSTVCMPGTQGRLLQWQPDRDAADKKALLASHPDLQARFLRESALRKESLLADIDFLDVTIRSEIMPSVQGAPAMMQLPLIPAYALTVHGES